MTNRRWTADEDQRLLSLRAAGKIIALIAKELDRTYESVNSRNTVLAKRSHRPPQLAASFISAFQARQIDKRQ
jgi:hypothetical protein